MPRRIELELTSERPDGSWTWRAAGAREPRGELEGSILPAGSKVGDVLRAEADFDIEGITVLSVLPPKDAKPEPERIEIIGPQREFQPVTSTLAGRRERGDRGDRERGDRRPPRRDRDDRGPRTPRDRDHDRPERPRGERPTRPRRERPAPPPPKPKAKKLRPGRAHRDALIAGLSPEQQPIAEQLFRGGIPGVRAALDEQNAAARTEGKPEVPAGTVMQIAETLVPQVRVADWLDRAEAAMADVEEIALRDLRAVVSSADDLTRDDATRELGNRLKEALERRTAAEQQEWLRDIEQSLTSGRVVRALRLSSRPPQPGESLPPELSTKLAEGAGAAMTADIAPDRWATLVDAVAYSPVRRDVTPAGIPAEPGDELLGTVRKHAGRAPAIAALFGVEPPPATAKRGGKRSSAGKRPASPAAPGGALRRPPKAPAGPIPSPILGRRIPPPPRPTAPPAPPAPAAPPTTGAPSDAPAAPTPTDTPSAPVPAGPARAADEIPNVAPGAGAPAEPTGDVPDEAPAAPTHAGGLAAEGAAREASSEPVLESVQEPVRGDDATEVPVDTAPEAAPQVDTVQEPVAESPAADEAPLAADVEAAPPAPAAAASEAAAAPDAEPEAPAPEPAGDAEAPAEQPAPAPQPGTPTPAPAEPEEPRSEGSTDPGSEPRTGEGAAAGEG